MNDKMIFQCGTLELAIVVAEWIERHHFQSSQKFYVQELPGEILPFWVCCDGKQFMNEDTVEMVQAQCSAFITGWYKGRMA